MNTPSIEQPLSGSERNKEFLRLIIIIGIMVLVLGAFILYLSLPLLTGTTIVLATQPIDPFDPLRGQYIAIRYEVSTIPTPEGAQRGDHVYVSLAKDAQGISRYSSASLRQPREGVFIKGEIRNIYGNQSSVEYGIEQYFFERHAEFETRGIQVEAKVGSDGQARITRLLQDGKPLTITYQNTSLLS